jgi:NitT/TauT family transport system permease protein
VRAVARAARQLSGPAVTTLSLLALLGVWKLLAVVSDSALPSPVATAQAAGASARQGYLWTDLAHTLARLVLAFAIGFAVSVVVGVLVGRSSLAYRFFGVWLTIGASTPALLVVVACYLAIGISDSAAVLAVALIVVPGTASVICDGVRAIDPGLSEMARLFGARPGPVARQVVLPQAAPWIFTAARTCWSLTWRIMVFAEVIGRPDGVGYRIQYWFQLANMPQVVVSAAPLVVMIVLVDVWVLRPVEKRIARWRPVELR